MRDSVAALNDSPENRTQHRHESIIQPLRNEIVESEKARMDFLKYKLLAVAALGTIGLGLKSESGSDPLEHIYILGIIPLVCLYVDMLCYHNNVRILVIGKYFFKRSCPYERFIQRTGNSLHDIGLYILRNRNDNESNKPSIMPPYYSLKKISKSSLSMEMIRKANRAQKESKDEIDDNPYKSGSGYFFELEDWALRISTLFLSVCIGIIGFIMLIYNIRISDIHAKDLLPLALIIPGIVGGFFSHYIKKKYMDKIDTLNSVSEMLKDDDLAESEA